MKLVYVGIDLLYPALPALWDAGCEIVEIFTCETDNETEFNDQVCRFAKEHRIPLTIGRLRRSDLARFVAVGCEALVCAGYYYRIPMDARLKMVNIHPSLLPIGRGAWPMPVTILRGLSVSGVTVHQMTEAFDEGAILLQESFLVSTDENLRTLLAKQRALLPGMMTRLAADFDRLYREAAPQGEGEYWPCPSEEDYPLTPDMPFARADRILRAFYGYECVYESGDARYALTGGVAIRTRDRAGELIQKGKISDTLMFPVDGGVIRAEKAKRLES